MKKYWIVKYIKTEALNEALKKYEKFYYYEGCEDDKIEDKFLDDNHNCPRTELTSEEALILIKYMLAGDVDKRNFYTTEEVKK